MHWLFILETSVRRSPTYNEFKDACMKLYEDYEADGTWSEGLYDKIQEIIAG